MANAMGDDDDVWGDDEDDRFFSQLATETETKHLLELQGQTGQKGDSKVTHISPKLATQAFQLRRENLPQQTSSAEEYSSAQGGTQDLDKILHAVTKQLKEEKLKSEKLQGQLYEAQGKNTYQSTCIASLRKENHVLLQGQMRKDLDARKAIDDERKALKREIALLTTKVRQQENDIRKMKTKSAFNRSIGGAQSQSITAPAGTPPGQTQKHRSVPNLLQDQLIPGVSAPGTEKKLETVGSQVNADIFLAGERDKQLISGKPGEEKLNFEMLPETADYRTSPLRGKLVAKIKKLLDLEFEDVRPTLNSIADRSRKEIMARFTRGVEMKTCFPDFTENMFLYGVQTQRRKELKMNQVDVPKQYPTMRQTSASSPGIVNLDPLTVRIQESFTSQTAWTALKEVKTTLQQFLAVLVGDERFLLYELQNLEILWKLLSWAKHFWRCIIFEEEFADLVSSCGARDKYIAELKSWTGLILKVVWRDFYVKELELWVRQLSLSILEIIVTTGYFERNHKRYEILYSVLKDTLTKDYIRKDSEMVRKCLTIITWSLADNKNILNYLCTAKNDNNCLAKLLGENVVKCFQEQSSHQATSLFLAYLHLIEALMVERPPRLLSRVVCPNVITNYMDEEEGGIATEEVILASQRLDVDVDAMALTQFADPEKYKFEEGTGDRARNFNKVKAASSWINPKEWESSILSGEKEERCQCRKTLLGSVFIMMHHVVRWWTQEMVHQNKRIERRWELEERQVQVWRELEDPTDAVNELITAFTRKMESLQEHILGVDVPDEAGWAEVIESWNPPEDIDPMLTCGERPQKETLFDEAVKSGLVVMSFCNFHSENIALAVGSEAFNCFTSLTANLITFEKKAVMSEAERRLLLEIIQSGLEEDVEHGEERIFSDRDFPESFKYRFLPFENVEISLCEDLEAEEENFDVFGEQKILHLTEEQHMKAWKDMELQLKAKHSKQFK